MNDFLSKIITWFSQKFKKSVQEKTAEETKTDFREIEHISVTATLAERLSTLMFLDSTLTISGSNARAKYLNDVFTKLWKTKVDDITSVCLGTGDVIVKPSTDGKRFGFDVVESKNFRIVDSIGDFIYGVIVRCDCKKMQNGDIYERFEYHKLTEIDGVSCATITQTAFKNGKNVPISSIEMWQNVVENTVIPNVDRLMIARLKCPKLNRTDINSNNGVPITFGNSEIINEVKNSWRRFNREMQDSELMIFADKSLFKNKKKRRILNGDMVTEDVAVLPEGKERTIMSVSSTTVDGQPLIKEFAPAIRDSSLDNAIERNLRMLEIFCGLSEGILSKSTLTYTNTDEVKKSLQATFSFITKTRNVVEVGIEDLIYIVNALCNINEVTPMGDYDINFDWSDSFVESMTERFNELFQSQGIGAVSTAEVRSWVMSEDIEVSKRELENIGAKELI